MKTITQRLMKILLVTLMMIIPLGINNSVVYGEDTGNTYELKVGAVYQIGDTIKLSSDVWIDFNDRDFTDNSDWKLSYEGEYKLPDPMFDDEWIFDAEIDIEGNTRGFTFSTGSISESNPPTGIRCIGGDGTEDDPFKFEPIFPKELAEGVEYKIGDTIKLSNDAWIILNDRSTEYVDKIPAKTYTLPKPDFNNNWGQFYFPILFTFDSGAGITDEDLLLGYNTGLTGSETVTGIRCISGNGESEETAFKFELMFDNTPSTDPTVIDTIDLTITPPAAGIVVSGIGNNQNPYPQVSISDNASYKLGSHESSLPAIWIKEDASSFEGIFEAGEYYYAGVWVRPKEGYKFNKDIGQKDINITNGKCESISKNYDDDGEIILIGIVVKVLCVESNYQFTQGNQTYYKGSNKDTEFIIKHKNPDEDGQTHLKLSEFVIEDKDGKEIKLKDTDYKITSGSVKITLKSSFLESLVLGTYKITAFFNDGHQVTSSLTIASQPSKPSYSIPKTGVE